MPSLSTITSNDTILDNAKQKIIKNAKTAFEEEKIIYRTNLVAAPDLSEIWKSGRIIQSSSKLYTILFEEIGRRRS